MMAWNGRPADDNDGPIMTSWRRKRRWPTWLWGTIAIATSAVLVGVGFVVWPILHRGPNSLPTPGPIPSSVACSPQACVTDGSHLFDPGSPPLALVEKAIAVENAEVRAAGRPYVSVALLNPYTVTPTSDVSLTRIIDELRGAYVAQVQVNATGILGVQLLLGNEGDSTETGEGPVVRELETLEGAPDHLVAVVGMGISTSQTEAAAATLSANDIIMVSAVTTADQLNGHYYQGLDAVSPDADLQVGLLSRVVAIPGNAALVRDRQATDIYTGDLVTDFTQAFGPRTHVHLYPYTPHTSFTDTDFQVIAANACALGTQPPLVLYAGRVSVLSGLITEFQTSSACKGKKITIATGDDADGLDPAVTRSPRGAAGSQVSVEYADLIDLGKLTATFKAFYQNDVAAVDPSSAGLSDVVTIATYNAMMTAWTAITTAYHNTEPNLPTRQDVEGLWSLLNGKYAPTGAAGPISLSAYGQLLNESFPVFLDSGGTRTIVKP
jgi:ABC-type branched-subunit amino acid transport system substrate-binding protein